jgi:epoxyqueuosine reductase
MTSAPKSFEKLKQELILHHFPLVGSVDYDTISPLYSLHGERFRHWIEKKFHGEMAYLQRGLERRLNPKLVFPELKSVIVVARPYPVQSVGSENLRYARYLNGADYHDSMKQDLEAVFKDSGFQYKICVDTSAVLERTWAALAGIGWIGKNTLLIHPQYGSYLFLGVVLTDQKFNQEFKPLKDYCGNCERCLKSCPTEAIVAPHMLDARKCISYLTLEKRGTWDQEVDVKGFVAGCDLCQEVCPFNQKPVKNNTDETISDYLILDESRLMNESKIEYESRVKGTALGRIKFPDFKRNLNAALKKP